MIMSSPQWGGGCLALLAGTALLYGIGALLEAMGIRLSLVIGRIIKVLLLFAIVRWILNEIFD